MWGLARRPGALCLSNNLRIDHVGVGSEKNPHDVPSQGMSQKGLNGARPKINAIKKCQTPETPAK